jgi:hypothetical protein
MKSRIIRATIAGTILAAFCAINTHAAPPAPAKPNTPANVESMLAEAYADLDHADHDYKGHRIDAMKQIEAAGKLVHLNLGGDGRGHEKQGVSDEQLIAAQGVLNQLKGEVKNKRVLHHVNKALEQLAIALKTK